MKVTKKPNKKFNSDMFYNAPFCGFAALNIATKKHVVKHALYLKMYKLTFYHQVIAIKFVYYSISDGLTMKVTKKPNKKFNSDMFYNAPFCGFAALNIANQYSIADIALYAYTHVAEEGNYDLSGYIQIKEWFKRIENQKNYINIKQS